jgi:hypothetical protein
MRRLVYKRDMGARDLDRVVELGAIIARLRTELRTHERELATLMAAAPVAPKTKKRSAGAKKKKGKSVSTTGKILRLLRAHPKDVFDAAEVARHLDAKVESVRTMLMRLVEAGDIHKTGRGAFRA